MSQLKVATFVESIRKESFNLRLARAIEKLSASDLAFDYVRIDNLPLYTQEFDSSYPPACQQLKDAIKAADAVLFVTPEYNRSIPGVLKNAIDIASRPWGTNSFASKPGAVIGTSIGSGGTAMAQQHLRNVLAYLDVPTLGQPEIYLQFKDELIAPDGTINDPRTAKLLGDFVEHYKAWVKRFKS